MPLPTDLTVDLAEQTARNLWQAYDAHLAHRKDDPAWEKQAWEKFYRCMSSSERLWKLKQRSSQSCSTPTHAEA